MNEANQTDKDQGFAAASSDSNAEALFDLDSSDLALIAGGVRMCNAIHIDT